MPSKPRHKLPCPVCGFDGNEDQKVWRVKVSAGIGECISCGFMVDAKVIKYHLGLLGDNGCYHTWAETGTKKSWCTQCDTDGAFNFNTGQFEESS